MDATLRQIWKTMATRPDQLVGAKNVPMWKPAVMAISIIHCVARLIDPWGGVPSDKYHSIFL